MKATEVQSLRPDVIAISVTRTPPLNVHPAGARAVSSVIRPLEWYVVRFSCRITAESLLQITPPVTLGEFTLGGGNSQDFVDGAEPYLICRSCGS